MNTSLIGCSESAGKYRVAFCTTIVHALGPVELIFWASESTSGTAGDVNPEDMALF